MNTLERGIQFINATGPISNELSSIIDIEGNVHSRRAFKSVLESSLYFQLRDTELAAYIFAKFQEILIPILGQDKEAMDSLEQWLIANCFLLQIGSKKLEEELKNHLTLQKYQPSILFFLQTVNRAKTWAAHTVKRVAIIIPTTQLAEEMVAAAMKDSLSQQGYEVKIFVEKTRSDIFFQFTQISIHEVWKQFYQQRNDRELADKCWKIFGQLPHFIPDDAIGDLTRRVEKFQPDFVLSTRYCDPNHVAFSRTCPMAFVQCDYTFSEKLIPLAEKADKERVKFCVPATKVCPEHLLGRIHLLGFPIRLGIKKMPDIAPLLQKWGVNMGERVVMMQMGRQGMGGALPLLIRHILKDALNLPPLVIFALTGNNRAMKEEIQQIIDQNTEIAYPRIKLLDALGENEMNELYNITSVLVGKAGGSATAELIPFSVFGIVFSSWSLEKVNVRYLQEINLGKEITKEDFHNIVPLLQEQLSKQKLQLNVIDWQERLQDLIKGV